MASSAWGIDLGNRGLKAIKLVRGEGGLRIDDFDVIEHEQILSVAGDNKESLLQTALAHFIERHEVKNTPVGVSVSGQQSFARFIKLPPVEPKKIPEIVRFEAIQQIPFPLDDVEWSYQLFQDKDSPDVEVGIFAMRKELVNRQINYFTRLGLNVVSVQMNPLAVYNGMYFDGRVDQTVMFMDSGAENTDLIIADGQTVWLRTLPIGGNNFTEILAKSFKLSFQKAEELKRNAATSKYAKQIFQAMRPIFADLVAEIQRSIGFYASVHREARISKIVAQGGTFQLPGLQKYLQQNLQLPVEKLDAFKAYPPADAKLAANLAENLLTLGGAYGLAVQVLDEGKIVSSLLPESIRRQKMWQEKTKWFAAAAATFLLGTLGVGASAYYHGLSYRNNQSIRSESEMILENARRDADGWRSRVQSKGQEDQASLVTVKSLQEYRNLWADLLTDVLGAPPKADLAQLKAISREKREQITITSIKGQYWADLTQPLQDPEIRKYVGKDVQPAGTDPNQIYDPMMGGYGGYGGYGGSYTLPMPAYPGAPMPGMPGAPMAGGGDPNADQDAMGLNKAGGVSGNQPRGFVLTIRGHTPNRGGAAFIDKALCKALTEKLGAVKQAKIKQVYYVPRAEVVDSGLRQVKSGGQIDEDAADAFSGEALITAMGRGVDPGRTPLDPAADRYFPDETIKNDYEFTAAVVVVLDPPPPPEEPPANP